VITRRTFPDPLVPGYSYEYGGIKSLNVSLIYILAQDHLALILGLYDDRIIKKLYVSLILRARKSDPPGPDPSIPGAAGGGSGARQAGRPSD